MGKCLQCSMGKPNTNNKTLPKRLFPMKGQQKEIHYPECHKGVTGKGEDNEVP